MTCVFRRLPPYPIQLVSSSSLVMRQPLHVRLVEIILKDSLKYTDYDVLAWEMGLATLLIQRSGLRLLARNVRFPTLMFRPWYKFLLILAKRESSITKKWKAYIIANLSQTVRTIVSVVICLNAKVIEVSYDRCNKRIKNQNSNLILNWLFSYFN